MCYAVLVELDETPRETVWTYGRGIGIATRSHKPRSPQMLLFDRAPKRLGPVCSSMRSPSRESATEETGQVSLAFMRRLQMARLFFSYSHRDELVRDELETHLVMLKRQGVIETWHDRRIVAGDEFGGQISEHLESADIILLLVSPYFLASSYCYDVEMARAMERNEAGSARVIPVIIDPCDWHSAPFGSLLAMPQDGKPVSKFPNVHDAFLQVTNAVRRAVAFDTTDDSPEASTLVVPTKGARLVSENPRSSNLRIRKQFSERDRDRFRDETFQYMGRFFEESLRELEFRNETIETDFNRIDGNTFTATIYENGESKSECSISLTASFGSKSIVYSSDKSSRGNSFNHMLSIVDDGTLLGLSASVSFGFGGRNEAQLSQQGAAEEFWAVLVSPLQR